MVDDTTRGANIRRIRKEFGLTQTQLAEKLYTKQNNITKYELGRTKSSKGLEKIAEFFGLPLEMFTEVNISQLEKHMPKLLGVDQKTNITTFLPIVSCASVLKNSHFSTAFTLIERLYNNIGTIFDIEHSSFDPFSADDWDSDYVVDSLIKAYLEEEIIEGVIDILPVWLIQWLELNIDIVADHTCSEEEIPEEGDSFFSSFIYLLRKVKETDNSKELRDSFWNERRSLYYAIHSVIRKTPKWIEISDYYMLLYKVTGAQRDLSFTMQNLQCYESSFIELCELGNQYALSLLNTAIS